MLSDHTASRLAHPERMRRIRSLALLDSPTKESFDRLTRLASRVFSAPVALVSLVKEDRQFLKSCVGLTEPWASRREGPISHSFCQHVVASKEPLVVENARQHPLVSENLGLARDLAASMMTEIELRATALELSGKTFAEEHGGECTSMFTRDVAGRATDQEPLRREIELTERLIASSVDGVLAFDRECRYTVWNPAMERITGLAAEAVLGRRAFELFPFLEETGEDRHFLAALAGETVPTGERRFTVPETGREGFFEANYSPLRDADGSVIGGVALIRDITERKRAEEALRASEERFRSLVHASAHTVWSTTAGGAGLSEWSTWSDFTGQSAEEKAGWGWLEAIHPDDRERTAEGWRRAVEARSDFEIEHRIRRWDGEYRHMAGRGVPVLDDAGEVREWIGAHMDVTEQRRAEEALQRAHEELELRVLERTTELASAKDLLEAQMLELRQAQERLRESEERFRSLVEATSQAVWTTNAAGEVVSVNPGWGDFTGQSFAEMKGWGWLEAIHPEDRTRTADVWKKAFQNRVLYEIEHRVRRHDGEYRTMLVRAVPIQAADGTIREWVGTDTDITERMQAKEALRRSEQRYRSLFDHNPHAVYVIDSEGTILGANQAFEDLTGYPQEGLIGSSFLQYVGPEEREPAFAIFTKTLTGEPQTYDTRVVRADGRMAEVRSISVPIIVDGQIEGVIGVAEDMTERKSLEERFRQSQKMEAIGRLAGGIAHDFNNVLTAVKGYAEMMIDDLDESDPLRQDAKEIADAGDRGADLVRQLMAFSRQQVIQPETISPNTVISGIENMLRRLIGEDVELTTELDPALGWVRADRGQLEQVLLNLAVNARDAMPEGGRLLISATNAKLTQEYARLYPYVEPGSYVLLSVSDTGHGMDLETQKKIFEPFFTTKEKGKGTGLGLSTVYGIAKQNGGYVLVESELGRGTTFRVYLPEVECVAPVSSERAPKALAANSEVVLLAEDQPAVRTFARRALERKGYQVLEAANGGEALLLCERHDGAIDLLLTDVVMPQMSGRELADRVRALRPGLPVLFMSGYAEDEIAHRGVLEPGTRFIAKPFSPEDLARSVRDALDSPGRHLSTDAAGAVQRMIEGVHRADDPSPTDSTRNRVAIC